MTQLYRTAAAIAAAICLFAAKPTQAQTAGTDGLYAATDNNYRIEVKFTPGKLTIVEPNKTSDYIQKGSSGIYNFTNPTNGISYVLEVADGGKALKAYKPGRASDFTLLKLIRAAAPTAQGAATPSPEAAAAPGVVRIRAQNKNSSNPDMEELWGARSIPGLNLEGKYTPEGEARPYLELKAGGKGTLEMYGAPDPQYIYAINWWIQANSDGTLVKTEHPAATEYMLIVEYDREYEGKKFDRLSLAAWKDGSIRVLDRKKPAAGK